MFKVRPRDNCSTRFFCVLQRDSYPWNYFFAVDSKPSERHVRWCCHHCSAGGPVQPQGSERSDLRTMICSWCCVVDFTGSFVSSPTVMEAQGEVMDADVFQSRLEVMLQWVPYGYISTSYVLTNTLCTVFEYSSKFQEKTLSLLVRDMFGEDCVDFVDRKNISLTVDGKTVLICLETRVS